MENNTSIEPSKEVLRHSLIKLYKTILSTPLTEDPQLMVEKLLEKAIEYEVMLIEHAKNHNFVPEAPPAAQADAAAYELDVNSIDTILELLQDIYTQLTSTPLIEIQEVDTIYMPPDTLQGTIYKSEHSHTLFESKEVQNRLETLVRVLHILKAQYQVYKGKTKPDAMRQTPYMCVDVTSLEKVVYICDENGNRTFVFNRELLRECCGITPQEMSLTKSQCDALILKHAQNFAHSDEYTPLGISIIYNKNTYPQRLYEALTGELFTLKSIKKQQEKATKIADPDGVYRENGREFVSLYWYKSNYGYTSDIYQEKLRLSGITQIPGVYVYNHHCTVYALDELQAVFPPKMAVIQARVEKKKTNEEGIYIDPQTGREFVSWNWYAIRHGYRPEIPPDLRERVTKIENVYIGTTLKTVYALDELRAVYPPKLDFLTARTQVKKANEQGIYIDPQTGREFVSLGWYALKNGYNWRTLKKFIEKNPNISNIPSVIIVQRLTTVYALDELRKHFPPRLRKK